MASTGIRLALAAVAGTLLLGTPALAKGTLDIVKERGRLVCGTSTGIAGFSMADDKGEWTGLDVDVCRALAAAIFDDPQKADFVPLSSKDRLVALQTGEIDVLPRTTTWTLGRDAGIGLDFTAVNYYDGQGFQVRRDLGVESIRELNGASICTVQGTTNELNLADYFRVNNMDYQLVTFQSIDDTVKAYESKRCDALTTDMSQLVSYRLKMPSRTRTCCCRRHLQGAARPLCPPGRRRVVRYRPLDGLRDGQCRGARRHQGQCRRACRQQRQPGNPPPARLDGEFGTTLGLTNDWSPGSSAMSAITASPSTGTWAPAARCSCRAASTRYGRRAAYSSPPRSADAR